MRGEGRCSRTPGIVLSWRRYYLSTVKAFAEDKDELAGSGIGMMARNSVQRWKMLKARLSEKQIQELKKQAAVRELAENADEYLGPAEDIGESRGVEG